MNLLVIDDCVEIVKLLASVMQMSGHEVDEACDGIEAVERLKRNSYDVVITDAEMVGLGGEEVCRFLKSQSPETFVIGMSGSFRALNKLRDAGADYCLSKPFNICDLERVIETRL